MVFPGAGPDDVFNRVAAVFLYVGPDVLMPVMSALAAALGLLLTFWRKLLGMVRRVIGHDTPASPAAPTEHDGLR